MINVNMTKAKEIAHDKRRVKRSKDFAPLDVEATIPMFAEQAEAKRVLIRQADATLQQKIDAAETEEDLKAELEAAKVL